jgi:hypothetical protein
MIRHRELSGILPELEQLGGQERSNRGTASAFLPVVGLEFDPNNTCNLCQSKPSFLRYEVLGDKGIIVRGGCCLPCLPNLLRRLKHCESCAVGQ